MLNVLCRTSKTCVIYQARMCATQARMCATQQARMCATQQARMCATQQARMCATQQALAALMFRQDTVWGLKELGGRLTVAPSRSSCHTYVWKMRTVRCFAAAAPAVARPTRARIHTCRSCSSLSWRIRRQATKVWMFRCVSECACVRV
eukprot:200392-Chlamydomonas_euryale.AAC.2